MGEREEAAVVSAVLDYLEDVVPLAPQATRALFAAISECAGSAGGFEDVLVLAAKKIQAERRAADIRSPREIALAGLRADFGEALVPFTEDSRG